MLKSYLRLLILSIFITCLTPTVLPAIGDVQASSTGPTASSHTNWVFASKITTQHFVFLSNIPLDKLNNYANFCEAFLGVVNNDFLPVKGKFPVTIYVLPDQPTCQAFLKDMFGQSNDHFMGETFFQENAIITYDGSGLGTFTHEIMHIVCHNDLRKEEPWAIEGIPSFFEKFYGYWQGKNLVVKWGYENPWRIYGLGDRLVTLKLADILDYTYDNADPSESPQRLVATFLYSQGKLKTYLDLAKRCDHKGYPTYVEAAFGKPVSELEAPWEEFLNDIVTQKNLIYKLPLSTICKSKDQYLALVKSYDLGELHYGE